MKSSIYDRAEDIYMDDSVEILEFNAGQAQAFFKVESQSSRKKYNVSIINLDDPEIIYTDCDCPYEGSVCKHALASLMELQDYLETGTQSIDTPINAPISNPNTEPPKIQPKPQSSIKNENRGLETVIDVSDRISVYHLNHWANLRPYEEWQVQSLSLGITNFQVEGNTLKASVPEKLAKYEVEISLNTENQLITSCSCKNVKQKLCKHKYAALFKLGQEFKSGQDIVFPLRDHSKAINQALKEYGFNYADENWQKLFNVIVQPPIAKVSPKNNGLSKISAHANWKNEAEVFLKNKAVAELKIQKSEKTCAILWQISQPFSLVKLDLLEGKEKKNGEIGAPIKRVVSETRHYYELKPEDEIILDKIYNTREYILHRKYKLPDLYSHSPLELQLQYHHYKLLAIHSFYRELLKYPNFLQNPQMEKISITELLPLFPQTEQPQLGFEFKKTEDYYALKPYLSIAGQKFYPTKVEKPSYGLILREQKLYLLSPQDARTLFFFQDKKDYCIRHTDLAPFLREFLVPILEKYPVKTIGVDLYRKAEEAAFDKKIYLSEVEDYLVLTPAFVYRTTPQESKEVPLDNGKHLILQEENSEQVLLIERNQQEENRAKEFLQDLHPQFSGIQEPFFALNVKEVLKSNWFFEMFQSLQENGFEVLGLKNLNKIRYNPYRPQVRLKAGSGIDWFDIEMEVSFGEQSVKLADIRKALMNNQNFIKLNDGSLGILPEEWLQKYSTLLKMGKSTGNKLKISEFQYDLIDELYDEIDNNKVFEELISKRNRLKKFKEIKNIQIPSNLKAELRNYQKEGYNWLNFLDEFGWGGCLADDMGLGKTVQVLAFLRNVSNRHKKATHLIVVPRSLVFNWINEIQKFCPDFKALNYTERGREEAIKKHKEYNLIISTYGLVRSDIETLKDIPFHYVVLDESQAVKNPNAKVSKAVKLLKAKNRLVMTGTPIENNTFDLYSQFDFLNPGMLGSMDYFKNEFANLIDRDRDEKAAQKLRKLVNPFILSRKKEEVAKELPEKIETIIYCDMPASQRKIYDFYRDKYRQQIAEAMEQQELNKSGFEVLQGLLKLRQICNSPALLNEEDAEFSHKSAKMEVLLSKIEEITTHNHKVLVFSFFKSMLQLVGEELKKKNINYAYLAGESSNREEIVKEFKENEDKQVFLISLKAGGFGLNLTEANYVFLIDPWWNPAVEQQAIDRTHRIGQEKQVFAYKLICKDTIEEKILQLQEKKQAVAKDIIQVEAGFLKKMNREDILDLFS